MAYIDCSEIDKFTAIYKRLEEWVLTNYDDLGHEDSKSLKKVLEKMFSIRCDLREKKNDWTTNNLSHVERR